MIIWKIIIYITIKTIDFSWNYMWFCKEEEAVELVISIIKRQPELKALNLLDCGSLTEENMEAIRQAAPKEAKIEFIN